MLKLTLLKNSVCNFHKDEEGMETLQVVMIIALAAIAGVAVYQFGSQAKNWCQERIDALFKNTDYGVSGSASGGGGGDDIGMCFPEDNPDG